MKNFLKNALIIIGMFIIAGVIREIINPTPVQTQVSKDTSAQNFTNSANKEAFVKGCMGEGDKVLPRSTCACAYDKLAALHGANWINDSAISDRILKQGYSQEETDATIGCFGDSNANIQTN